ncbi:MAG: ribonucleoside-diphosphate reductase subunit alpha [Candidatus Aquirickettsiella gammari]|uniref:Ribonucleoside-diphosphate reductase n=1 Tax=Candidatus Aquirickettsiella gammari TaxID=2016198 RepID=A0A370CHC8_9COXI|nr:MAG: ribonucleoside-diphosphate reductase subunit alpha [Candidatus Aquirickettsiella gammari]
MSGLSSELMTSSLLLNNAEILLSNPEAEQENKFICTLQVIKRNGKLVNYDPSKIRVAITKAFLAVEGGQAALSTRIHERVSQLTQQVTHIIQQRHPNGGTLPIEAIQDQVELALMRVEAHQVARAYVLYREERRKMRAETNTQSHLQLQVSLADGSQRPLDLTQLSLLISETCKDLSEVKHELILQETLRNLYDGMPILEIDKALIISARTLVEQDPNYTYATARFLLRTLYTEALDFLELPTAVYTNSHAGVYHHYFQHYIKRGVALELLDPQLRSFDLEKLGKALLPERDQQFTYLSLQTLYDRYFLHADDVRFELPQAFFMRIAMGLAQQESNKEDRAIEFYQLLSSFDYMASTPTLFNAGTLRPQLSSCFLTTVADDLDQIYSAIKDNALLSKFAGGLGNDWTPVRAMGARIKGTNGKSLGVVPFLNVANASAVAVNQGGKRKGAVCAYLETWHLDIEEFLELRKNTGDDRRRTHDMNTANWVPDLFMKRLLQGENWTLFSPDETPDLHDIFGLEFEEKYQAYEAKAARGEIKNFKTIPATNLWRKMLSLLFETGHPWITFKDPCNLRSPQQHIGTIHSSNLCTEITLNTSIDEIAVCNLGSINLPQHLTASGELDQIKLRRTIRTAIRMLDNVIDINYYTVPQARRSNLKHRPIGLGLMGFQDALYQLRIPYASEAAITFADHSMELISYYAIEASSDLAKERGRYESFQGSLWSQGILPLDSIALLQKTRGELFNQDQTSHLDWQSLRQKVIKDGMRNSNCMAIAPTATISNICGVAQSIEPTYQNLFVKSNMSGEFTVINPYLVKDLKLLGLWDAVMLNDLKYYDGSLQKIERVPDSLKQLYATAFEIPTHWLVEAGSRRQKWIDQSQSLNLYMAQASGKKLDELYKNIWLKGLKTSYYLRTMGATHTEKATLEGSHLNSVQSDTPASGLSCSILDPDCESCQ